MPATGETWAAINQRLRYGLRGLPGGSTLAQLLEVRRGVPVGRTPPDLSEEQILAWADAHFAVHKKWPAESSGPVPGTNETWIAIASALRAGRRGLRCRSSLAQLLAQRRGARNIKRLPPLTEEQILAWARAHFEATGRWPNTGGGPIAQSPGETWAAIDGALRIGVRGLPGGSSLPQLLAQQRGVRNRGAFRP